MKFKLPKITKKNWMQIHTYLSLFFLPACLIYAITGTGFILGFRADAGATIYEFSIKEMPEKGEAKDFIIQKLRDNNLPIPKNTELRYHRGAPIMGDLKYNIALGKNRNDELVMRVTNRGLYGILLLMHLAKGKYYFDIIAVAFSVSLILFYLSGLIVTQFCKNKRKEGLIALLLGGIITGLAVIFSVG